MLNKKQIFKEIKKLFIEYLDLQDKNLVRSGSEISDIVDSSRNKEDLFPVENKVNKLKEKHDLILSLIILLNIETTLFPIDDFEEIIYEFTNCERRVEKMETYNYYFHNRDGKISVKVNNYMKNKQRKRR